MAKQPGPSFAVLLRQLRVEAQLTQEELAEAASVSPRSVSDLERGVNRTARKDTALLLADALGLAGPARDLFVAVARGRVPTGEKLAAAGGTVAAAIPGLPYKSGGFAGRQAELAWLLGEVIDSPYRGLSAFEEQDAAFFFGREAATSQVLERISRCLEGTGLMLVSGVSGVGKSSLLRAGVLPRVREAGLASVAGSASWPYVVFTPTRTPLDELALRVALLAGTDASAVRRGLDADPAGFALPARQAALVPLPRSAGDSAGLAAGLDRPQRHRLLLVVDQFEELFTLCADERQRRAFVTALHAAASVRQGADQAPAALVLLAVRADFEARCADYPELADAVQDRYLVTSMTERQLRMAINEPAKKAGSQVDDDLVDVLLTEVGAGRRRVSGLGMLPLLSHALDQAWRSRTGDTVTLADYERAGGMEGAVADSAQRAYDRLTPSQQAVARQIFIRLTATSSEGIDSADRASRAELTEGKSAVEAQDVDTVLESFAAERLLTLAATTVEISHEALLTAWPLLRDTWLTETHADRIVRTRLHNTATEWTRHSRDPSYLYSGSLLAAAGETATRNASAPVRHPPLSQTERDFLRASGHAHQRRARRRHAVIAGLVALTAAAVAAAGIAVHNAGNATRQHAIALSRQLAAESVSIDSTAPVTARRLAAAAWRVFPTDQASSAMATLLAEQQQNGILLADTVNIEQGGVNGVAFSPDGKLLAGASGEGNVRLWDRATAQPVRVLRVTSGRDRGVNGVAFSPDGRLLASADADGTVRLLDPGTGQPVRVLRGSPPRASFGVSGVAFSPDGQLLASADADLTVRLWDPASGRLVRALPVPLRDDYQNVNGVAFSPDGRLLAGADGDGTVQLWDPGTGRLVRILGAVNGNNGVNGVAFSPDGRLLAGTGRDGTVRLWDPGTGHALGVPLRVPVPEPALHYSGMTGVAFSPDGKLLAGADGDGTVRLLDRATGQPVGASLSTPSTGPSSRVNEVAYSPDGKLLATAHADATTRLWNLATGLLISVVHAPVPASSSGGFTALAFSQDGRLLASIDGDGAVRLLDRSTGWHVRVLHTASEANGVGGVAFSPDSRLLASADSDGNVRLWDPATGRVVRVLRTATSNTVPLGVTFSPDGKLLASVDSDGTVRLWTPVTGQPVRVLHTAGKPVSLGKVAFSPDGTLLAGAALDGTVRLWGPVTGQPTRVLHTASGANGVGSVAFSPDGKLLASTARPGSVQLWDLATSQAVGVPFGLAEAGHGVSSVAFSPDGKLLASADTAGTVRFWKVPAFVNPSAALCADVGGPTGPEWKQYAAGEPQLSVCSSVRKH